MESIEVVRTLSQLKQELMRVNGIKSDPSEVRLFFSIHETKLYVHSYKDHRVKLLLGEISLNEKKLVSYRGLSKVMRSLVNHGIANFNIDNNDFKQIVKWLNECVKEYCYYKD